MHILMIRCMVHPFFYMPKTLYLTNQVKRSGDTIAPPVSNIRNRDLN